MKRQSRRAALRKRIAATRRELDDAIWDESTSSKQLAAASKSLEELVAIANLDRKADSLHAVVGLSLVLLYVAGVLGVLRVDEIPFHIKASASSMSIDVGGRSSQILRESVAAKSLVGDCLSGPIEILQSKEPASERSTNAVVELRIARLAVNQGAQIGIQTTDGCSRISVLSGIAELVASVRKTRGESLPNTLLCRLEERHSVRVCASEPLIFEIYDPELMALGEAMLTPDRFGRRWSPAVEHGELYLGSEAQPISLRPVHVLTITGTAGYRLVAGEKVGIQLDGMGTAQSLSLGGPAGEQRNLMPSVLKVFSRSPRLSGALTIVAAIIGTLLAVRDRWLALRT